MTIEYIQSICLAFEQTTEEIKWKSDLVFMVARKMFCLIDLQSVPTTCAFKVRDEDFDEILSQPFFIPAPYFAQHKWVTITDIEKVSANDLTKHLQISYELVKARLSKKRKAEMGF